MGGYTTPKLSSRNQEINSRDRGRGGSPSLLLQFLPRRVVRFRWCNGSLVSFPRRGGDLSRGGWRTITLHLQFHAALASSLPFPLRFFSISFPPKIPSFVALPLSLPLRPSPSPSHPSPFPKTRHDPPRNSRSFGEEREREGRERRRQTVAKLLGAADDCLRFVPTSPAAPPRICPVK